MQRIAQDAVYFLSGAAGSRDFVGNLRVNICDLELEKYQAARFCQSQKLREFIREEQLLSNRGKYDSVNDYTGRLRRRISPTKNLASTHAFFNDGGHGEILRCAQDDTTATTVILRRRISPTKNPAVSTESRGPQLTPPLNFVAQFSYTPRIIRPGRPPSWLS